MDGITRDFLGGGLMKGSFCPEKKISDAELGLVLLLHAQLYTDNKKGQRRTN